MSAEELTDEEQARAGVYALLARLYHAPPDRDLLGMLASRESAPAEPGSPFVDAWSALAEAARRADPAALGEEFDALFAGTGKALVTPYVSAYLTGAAHHAPLVRIRSALGMHGFERLQGAHEPEDHVAALCEAMRHLVTLGDVAMQKEFFENFLWPAAEPFCTAIKRCGKAGFYSHVAQLTQVFAEVEHEAFQMD